MCSALQVVPLCYVRTGGRGGGNSTNQIHTFSRLPNTPACVRVMPLVLSIRPVAPNPHLLVHPTPSPRASNHRRRHYHHRPPPPFQALRIQKALLRRHETVTLSTTMQDVNVYVLAHWVLGFLDEHRAIARYLYMEIGKQGAGVGILGGGTPFRGRFDRR